MSDSENNNGVVLAVDALRSYADFLGKQAPALMGDLLKELSPHVARRNADAKSLYTAISKILAAHPKYKIDVLATIAEYESPKKNRIDTTENDKKEFVVHDPEDSEFEEFYKLWQEKQAQIAEQNIIEPDEIAKV